MTFEWHRASRGGGCQMSERGEQGVATLPPNPLPPLVRSRQARLSTRWQLIRGPSVVQIWSRKKRNSAPTRPRLPMPVKPLVRRRQARLCPPPSHQYLLPHSLAPAPLLSLSLSLPSLVTLSPAVTHPVSYPPTHPWTHPRALTHLTAPPRATVR